ncbi:MAG: hypothetical protein U0821_06285 [Chloroflexota bacterium]
MLAAAGVVLLDELDELEASLDDELAELEDVLSDPLFDSLDASLLASLLDSEAGFAESAVEPEPFEPL